MLHADPNLSTAERVDRLCDRFEAAWRAGEHPRIDDYLAAAPETDRPSLREALLAIDRELRGMAATDTSVTASSVRTGDDDHVGMTILHVDSSATTPTTIARFNIRGALGSGAFGKVYRAFDPQLGREVAVKVPVESAVKSDKERAQFLKEARAAATINHPNVCQVHEVGEFEGRPYIVMPLIEGQSLADALKARKEPLPEKQTALIVRRIAVALAAAHDKGIVHRDLKPANVMFDRERKNIVVMDFGLARGPQFGDARGTQSGVVMGTPAYMSPEQARGDSKVVGPAADIFSLGVILYELLTDQRPFHGTATEVIGQILHVEPPTPSQLRPGIDPRLEAACLRAMAKNPADRFATMKEFAAAIDVVLRTPTGSAAETARAEATLRTGDETSVNSGNMAEVFAALSADRKQAQAETAAAVEAALAKHRTPRWLLVAIGLLLLGGMTALAGIAFSLRSDKVLVTVELTDVDLSDKTLSFFLDDEPIPAEQLANPVELAPGVHMLVIKRGKEIVKRVRLTVTGGLRPGIKIKDVPLAARAPEPKRPIVWTPLIKSADELVEDQTMSTTTDRRSVTFHDGELELRGAGAAFRPGFDAKNYILRAKLKRFSGVNIIFRVRCLPGKFAGYGAWFNPAPDAPRYGLGKHYVSEPWNDIALTMQYVEDEFPVDYAVAAYGNRISIYINGEHVVSQQDDDSAEGRPAITLTGESHAVLQDVEVCNLDGTGLTPEDVFPQRENPLLSPTFLTAKLKQKNLLKDGGFEVNGLPDWRFESWRQDRRVMHAADTPTRTGLKALKLECRELDAISLVQTVELTPFRRYLFSGWIRSKNMQFGERNRRGAHLNVRVPGFAIGAPYRFASSPSANRPDWTYYAVVFDSGSRTKFDLAAQLGGEAGTVTGTAWFDDLCLVELASPPATDDADRRAAKWLQRIGGSGKLKIVNRIGLMEFNKETSLPAEPFHLIDVGLFIPNGQDTPEALHEFLAPLRHVENLWINPKRDLEFLDEWSQLVSFHVNGPLTYDNIDTLLKACPDLEQIQLNPPESRADLYERMAKFPRLKRLFLFHAKLDAADYEALKTYPALSWLHLGGCDDTDEANADLKAALPGLNITRHRF